MDTCKKLALLVILFNYFWSSEDVTAQMVLRWLVRSIFDQQYLREEEKRRAQLQQCCRHRMQLQGLYVSIMCDMTLPGSGSINHLWKLVNRLKVALNYELLNFKLFTRALTFVNHKISYGLNSQGRIVPFERYNLRACLHGHHL